MVNDPSPLSWSPSDAPSSFPHTFLLLSPKPGQLGSQSEFVDIGTRILAVSGLLVICLFTSYWLRHRKIFWFPDSVAAMVYGMIVGICVISFAPDEVKFLTFNPSIFFFALLPPIILEAGYTMKRRRFFKNIVSIVLFAVVGTLISTAIIGTGVYLLSEAGVFEHKFSMLETFFFATLASDVDPVATLSILGSKDVNADPTLYSLVFGESVINDAVCIVMFNVLNNLGDSTIDTKGIFVALWKFTYNALGSIGLGCGVALVCCFIFKRLHLDQEPPMETLLVLLFAWSSYSLAEVVHLSGIMSIFFCGILLSHYNWYNISEAGRKATVESFRALKLGSETLIFCYLGITLALSFWPGTYGYYYSPILISVVVGLCFFSRAVHIVLLSALANLGRRVKITGRMQVVMWWSGLRGAIAFALALNIPGPNNPPLLTTALFLVIFTTIICGGLTETLVSKLGLKRNADNGSRSNSQTRAAANQESPLIGPGAWMNPFYADVEEERSSQRVQGCWKRFDTNYMKPLFGGQDEERASAVPMEHSSSHGAM